MFTHVSKVLTKKAATLNVHSTITAMGDFSTNTCNQGPDLILQESRIFILVLSHMNVSYCEPLIMYELPRIKFKAGCYKSL